MSDFRQTGTVQKYVNNNDRLNIYAKMTEYYLINIILNDISARLCQGIAHYKSCVLTYTNGQKTFSPWTSSAKGSIMRNNRTRIMVRGRGMAWKSGTI